MVGVVTPMVDCSGGAPAPNSGDRGANVDGGEVEDYQREVGSERVCRKRREEGGLYKLDGVLRSVTDDDGDYGDKGHQGQGRGHGEVQGAQSIVIRVPAQEEVVKHSGVRAASVVTADGRSHPPRRLLVEHEGMGMPGGLLVLRGGFGQKRRYMGGL